MTQTAACFGVADRLSPKWREEFRYSLSAFVHIRAVRHGDSDVSHFNAQTMSGRAEHQWT
ncbi:hypothetical protein BDN72DRAFT_842542 [Pluteus cervinus]|uniref:Uncharacterized protein n=1 Tax=Pluteus cervinus TaxID=181527 RepID=A0ACD3ARC4_9AGAR|nr:hypothetical protein BDN72DRAFT_842542 [Pluteus cervinus]